MLFFFLSSLLFLSNSLSVDKLPAREAVADNVKMGADDVMMHIQMVMQNQTVNSKSLIESLEKLDPATIANVVVLIKQLLASSAADLLALQQSSELSITAYNDANGAYDAAVAEKVRLDEVILAHQASLAQQVIVVQTTLDTKNTASGAKTNAQATLDEVSPRLNGEQSTLTQVLGLINGLTPGHQLRVGRAGYVAEFGRCLDPSGSCVEGFAPDTEVHAVTCCSDVLISGWINSCGETNVYAARDIGGEGCQTLNWNDANAFCSSKGGRLCTVEEIATSCVRSSGCSYDAMLVWTSSQ